MEIIIYEWMHVCMIMLKNIGNMVRLSSTMLESRVTMPFGKDYGLNALVTRVLPRFPNYNHLYECIGA